MGIQIHQLGARPGSLASSDDFAVDTGTATYRTPLSTLSDAVDSAGITFTSGDTSLTPTSKADVALITSGETKKSLFNKLSTIARNVRWLVYVLGNQSISGIGDGTISGALNELNNLAPKMGSWSSTLEPGSLFTWQDLPKYNVFIARTNSSGIGGVAVGIRWSATNIRWMCLTSSTNGKCYMTSISWTLSNDGTTVSTWSIRTDSSGTDGAPVSGLSYIYAFNMPL